MEAKELRIGNYVKCLSAERQLIGITKRNGHNETSVHYAEFSGLSMAFKLIHLNPIPLTEEWLIKLGFEGNEDYVQELVYEYHSPEHTFQLTHECDHIWLCGNEETHLEIKYVNQLQNLYFALTGRELI